MRISDDESLGDKEFVGRVTSVCKGPRTSRRRPFTFLVHRPFVREESGGMMFANVAYKVA